MTGVAMVEQIVGILVAGIKGLATGIGEGVSDLAQNLFLTGTGETQTLSVFGTLICVFAGISLCIGLSRLIFQWVSSLGARK